MTFHASPLWRLISQSDTATWLILGILLLLSIAAWTVFIQKLWHVRSLIATVRKARSLLQGCQTARDLDTQGLLTTAYPLAALTDQFKTYLLYNSGSPDQREELSTLLSGIAHTTYLHSEQYTIVLKSGAELGPLLGLLGTIWGLIHSFLRISTEKSADIAIVAPGIAEALITTLAGLLVAIPALFFYHIVQRLLAVYEQQLCLAIEEYEQLFLRIRARSSQ